MLGKHYKLPEHLPTAHFSPTSKSPQQRRQSKRMQQLQNKQQNRKMMLYGQYYNHSQHGLNKEKKYMIEEERNTEIQKANRLLLQKIKKIGQRSGQLPRKNKVVTQACQEEMDRSRRGSKISQFYSRKETTFQSTHHQLLQSKLSEADSFRKTPNPEFNEQRKILFKGTKEIDGTEFAMTICIEKGFYVIYSHQAKMQHKIQMTLEDYKLLLKQALENNHSNIFKMLTFNGALLELNGAKPIQVSIIEEQQITLPLLNKQKYPKSAKNRRQTQ